MLNDREPDADADGLGDRGVYRVPLWRGVEAGGGVAAPLPEVQEGSGERTENAVEVSFQTLDSFLKDCYAPQLARALALPSWLDLLPRSKRRRWQRLRTARRRIRLAWYALRGEYE